MKSALALVVLGIVSGSTAVGCGYAEVAPPRAPTREMPKNMETRSSPPEPGTTRVLIDANGDQASVVEVVDRSTMSGRAYGYHGETAFVHGKSETVKPLCVAPCVADLRPGMHILRFTSDDDGRESEARVQVGDESKLVRHAMGHTESNPLGVVSGVMLTALGASALVAGGSLYAASAAGGGGGGGTDGPPSYAQYVTPTLVAGAVALAAGITVLLVTRPVRQRGATTEVSLSARR